MAKQTLSNWQERYKSAAYWWSVGFGSGLIKPAPGTWGSLAGLLIGYGILKLPQSFWILLIFIAATTLLSVFAINQIERKTGIHDAPEIVIDEFAGMWVSLLPLTFASFGYIELASAFILFRFYDIIKPWPIEWLDKKVSGGFGVMVDDLAAGIFAAATFYVVKMFIL
ncbi:phosphatidylglycerophosphatase A [Kordiimonas sp. SCSIO 12603]|uniref:phosphatidylglycerophosphatase A family protein n=1 Tax=Kordiimonas sp. SCSIO 12603 TaxID=2829596 RepID=UPI0021080C41|nr:phosphatidylglycerophosphatase A [Kordiimonas sp. SCSIO 12603]UTW57445.1 phosphatidylglycerophosphatase A [Kordiimonas sp. SCSIO 12603]